MRDRKIFILMLLPFTHRKLNYFAIYLVRQSKYFVNFRIGDTLSQVLGIFQLCGLLVVNLYNLYLHYLIILFPLILYIFNLSRLIHIEYDFFLQRFLIKINLSPCFFIDWTCNCPNGNPDVRWANGFIHDIHTSGTNDAKSDSQVVRSSTMFTTLL